MCDAFNNIKGRKMDDTFASVSYLSGGRHITALDAFMPISRMSVYCKCGRVVVQDRSEMKVKLELGKELQCMSCRNIRISREIDALNEHYEGIVDSECF